MRIYKFIILLMVIMAEYLYSQQVVWEKIYDIFADTLIDTSKFDVSTRVFYNCEYDGRYIYIGFGSSHLNADYYLPSNFYGCLKLSRDKGNIDWYKFYRSNEGFFLDYIYLRHNPIQYPFLNFSTTSYHPFLIGGYGRSKFLAKLNIIGLDNNMGEVIYDFKSKERLGYITEKSLGIRNPNTNFFSITSLLRDTTLTFFEYNENGILLKQKDIYWPLEYCEDLAIARETYDGGMFMTFICVNNDLKQNTYLAKLNKDYELEWYKKIDVYVEDVLVDSNFIYIADNLIRKMNYKGEVLKEVIFNDIRTCNVHTKLIKDYKNNIWFIGLTYEGSITFRCFDQDLNNIGIYSYKPLGVGFYEYRYLLAPLLDRDGSIIVVIQYSVSSVIYIALIKNLFEPSPVIESEVKEEITPKASPNPFDDRLQIENLPQEATIEVLNTIGELVERIKIANPIQNNYEINTQNYPSGLYILRIIDKYCSSSKLMKLIKQ